MMTRMKSQANTSSAQGAPPPVSSAFGSGGQQQSTRPQVARSVGVTLFVASIVLGLLFGALWAVVAVVFGDKEPVSFLTVGMFAIGAPLIGRIGIRLRGDGNRGNAAVTVMLALVLAFLIIALWSVGGGSEVAQYRLWAWIAVPITSIVIMYLVSSLSNGLDLSGKERVPNIVSRTLRIVGVLGFFIAISLPFYFMIVASMRPRAFLLQNPTKLTIPFSGGIRNMFTGYINAFSRFRFGRYIINSTVVSLFTVMLTLIPAILGGYAVTRLRFRGRRFLSSAILLIYMFPPIVLVIPLYSIFTQLGVRNSLLGLLLVYPAMTTPVALYMLRSYFKTLPRDIEEAGMIDGCTRAGVIFRITLPLSLPALASVALYVFMIAWNEFLFAFMFLDNPDIFTLSRGVVALNTQEVPRQFLMAGSVIITVPVMLLFFYFEKFLVSGLASGGVKG